MTDKEYLDIIDNWDKPFCYLLKYLRYSIDYTLQPGKNDHKWFEDRGFHTKFCSDCTYAVEGYNFNATSYGWGTVYVENRINDNDVQICNELKMFIQMYLDGIIKLWRISIYINSIHYIYNVDYNSWQYYDRDSKSWRSTYNPIFNDGR